MTTSLGSDFQLSSFVVKQNLNIKKKGKRTYFGLVSLFQIFEIKYVSMNVETYEYIYGNSCI